MKQIIISKTAYCSGYGSNRWKHSAGFSATERQAIKNNTAIVVITGEPYSNGNSGTTLRIATYGSFGYSRRVPTEQERAEIEKITGPTLYQKQTRTQRLILQKQYRNKKRAELAASIDQQMLLARLSIITLAEAVSQSLISEQAAMSFGINSDEHTELLNDTTLLRHDGNQLYIFEGHIGKPASWHKLYYNGRCEFHN